MVLAPVGIGVDAVVVGNEGGVETTALGAAYLAGLGAGLLPEPAEFAKGWKRDKRFQPRLDAATREAKYAGWKTAVRKLLA